jgi:hypothetical protein
MKMGEVKLGRLVFMNAEARPKNILIECSAQSVAHIMDWYGGYCAGDRYTVAFNGRNVPMDINGECLLTVDELEKE